MDNAISIEYPANVKNPDKAIAAVGGPAAIIRAVETNGEQALQLRLRPDDPFQHPIESRLARNRDVLVKVTLPKSELERANGDLKLALANCHDQGIQFKAEPEYVCEPVFKFREMADFQWNTQDSRFANMVKNSIFPGNYEQIKQITSLEGAKTADEISTLDIMPPPRFSGLHYQFPYAYRQNPSVVVTQDEITGQTKVTNRSLPVKLASVIITYEEPAPTGPCPGLKEPLGALKQCVEALQKFFDTREMATRQPIELALPSHLRFHIKQALPYVVYQFKSGPFRRSYVKFGIDPRKHSKYSQYQVEFFRITDRSFRDNSAPLTRDSYTFDGKQFPRVAGLQLCDVTDPQLVDLIKKAQLRSQLDFMDGWYVAEDIQRIRKIMRYKLLCLAKGQTIDPAHVQKLIDEKPKLDSDEDFEEDEEFHASGDSDED